MDINPHNSEFINNTCTCSLNIRQCKSGIHLLMGNWDEFERSIISADKNEISHEILKGGYHYHGVGDTYSYIITKTITCEIDGQWENFSLKNNIIDLLANRYYSWESKYIDDDTMYTGYRYIEEKGGHSRIDRASMIAKLSDDNGQIFYAKINVEVLGTCESCDGKTTNTAKIIYSDKLSDLCKFCYTQKQFSKTFKVNLPNVIFLWNQ